MNIAASELPADSNPPTFSPNGRGAPSHAGDVLPEGMRRVYEMAVDPVRPEVPRVGWARRTAGQVGRVFSLHGKGVGRDVAGAVLRGDLTRARKMASTVTRSSELGFIAQKVVSPKYRCVWFSAPKVASRSIMSVLIGTDPECKVYQTTASDLLRLRPDTRDWFTFAFVRHPFHRALSFWYELHVSPLQYTDRREYLLRKCADLCDRFYGLSDTQDFDAYCEWLNTPYGADECADRHFMSLEPQLRLGDGRLPDFLGRLENIESDWRTVAERLGIPVPELPFVHSGLGWNAAPEQVSAMRSARASLLTERNSELLSVRYAGDLKLWDCSAGS